MFMSNAIKVIVIGAIIGVIIFCYKLYKNKQSDLSTTQNFNWRTKPGSMGSVVGQSAFLLVIILVLTFLADKETGLKMANNQFFWAYPCLALVFYVFFPMGTVIPVALFRAINTGIMIILIPVVVYTTFFNGNDSTGSQKKSSRVENQTPPALPVYKKLLTLNGTWQKLETVPQNGFHYRFDLPDTLTEIQTMYLRHPETKKTLTVLGDFSETYMDAPNPGDIPLLVRIVSGEEKKVFLTVIKY